MLLMKHKRLKKTTTTTQAEMIASSFSQTLASARDFIATPLAFAALWIEETHLGMRAIAS